MSEEETVHAPKKLSVVFGLDEYRAPKCKFSEYNPSLESYVECSVFDREEETLFVSGAHRVRTRFGFYERVSDMAQLDIEDDRPTRYLEYQLMEIAKS